MEKTYLGKVLWISRRHCIKSSFPFGITTPSPTGYSTAVYTVTPTGISAEGYSLTKVTVTPPAPSASTGTVTWILGAPSGGASSSSSSGAYIPVGGAPLTGLSIFEGKTSVAGKTYNVNFGSSLPTSAYYSSQPQRGSVYALSSPSKFGSTTAFSYTSIQLVSPGIPQPQPQPGAKSTQLSYSNLATSTSKNLPPDTNAYTASSSPTATSYRIGMLEAAGFQKFSGVTLSKTWTMYVPDYASGTYYPVGVTIQGRSSYSPATGQITVNFPGFYGPGTAPLPPTNLFLSPQTASGSAFGLPSAVSVSYNVLVTPTTSGFGSAVHPLGFSSGGKTVSSIGIAYIFNTRPLPDSSLTLFFYFIYHRK